MKPSGQGGKREAQVYCPSFSQVVGDPYMPAETKKLLLSTPRDAAIERLKRVQSLHQENQSVAVAVEQSTHVALQPAQGHQPGPRFAQFQNQRRAMLMTEPTYQDPEFDLEQAYFSIAQAQSLDEQPPCSKIKVECTMPPAVIPRGFTRNWSDIDLSDSNAVVCTSCSVSLIEQQWFIRGCGHVYCSNCRSGACAAEHCQSKDAVFHEVYFS